MWKQNVIVFLITTYLCVAGCATTHSNKGVFHKVGKGETLWGIAHAYGVDLQDLAEANNIKDHTQIKKGRGFLSQESDRPALERVPQAAWVGPARRINRDLRLL